MPDDLEQQPSVTSRVKNIILGAPRNINDPGIFHKIALIPVLAWIGLGADGLSSSSYGPEEAFRGVRKPYIPCPLAGASYFINCIYYFLRLFQDY